MRRDAAGHPGAGAGRPAGPGALDRAVRRLVRPAALTAARARRPAAELPGVEVTAAAQPLLWGLLDAVAADLGRPAPDRLRVCLGGTNASLEHRRRVLLLPLSHLAALTELELRAAVGHELGRRAAGAPRPTRSLAAAFAAYSARDVQPLLRAGLRPPLAAGFALYLSAPAVRSELGWAPAPGDGTAWAAGLLLDLDGLELALLAGLGRALRPVDWRDGPARALPAAWADSARWVADRGLRAAQLADELRATARRQPGDQVAADDAVMLLGGALAHALVRDGWTVLKPPGVPCRLTKDGAVLAPREELAAIARGEVSPAAWTARCRRIGIAELALGDGLGGRRSSRSERRG